MGGAIGDVRTSTGSPMDTAGATTENLVKGLAKSKELNSVREALGEQGFNTAINTLAGLMGDAVRSACAEAKVPPKPDPAMQAYQEELSRWNQENASNEEAKRFNKGLDEQIGFKQTELACMERILADKDFFRALDGELTTKELEAIASPDEKDVGKREAAQWLLAHPDSLKKLQNDDGNIILAGNGKLMGQLRQEIADLEKGRKEVKEMPPKPTPPSASTGTAPSTGAATGTAGGAGGAGGAAGGGAAGGAGAAGGTPTPAAEGQLFAPPSPSKKSGLEGASENITNTLSSVADAYKSVTDQLSNPDLTDAQRKQLEARLTQLTQLQQMLTSLWAQLQQMMSNMMKMFSDAAMHSIQNMR